MDLSLKGIVDVTVSISPTTTYRKFFDSACIIGGSTKISTTDRIKEFSDIDEVLAGGFVASDPEYKAAQLYFSQKPTPAHVYIGVKGTSETLLQAITACRSANPEWYIAIPTESVLTSLDDTTLKALGAYVETCSPESMLAITLTDKTKYLATMQAFNTAKYQKTILQYVDIATNTADSEKTGIAGIIGLAMGKNRPNSAAFNLAYKTVTNLSPTKLATAADLQALLDAKGNVYTTQGYYYNIFRQGFMTNGDYFDEVLNLDMMVNQLRSAIMSELMDVDKIPQTETGINMLTATISTVLDDFVVSGFIAPGIWLGSDIMSLKEGDMLSAGYLIQFESIANQLPADRIARIAPNCYVAIKLAGAMEHVVIGLNVSK